MPVFLKYGLNCVSDVTESDNCGDLMKIRQLVVVVFVVQGTLFLF